MENMGRFDGFFGEVFLVVFILMRAIRPVKKGMKYILWDEICKMWVLDHFVVIHQNLIEGEIIRSEIYEAWIGTLPKRLLYTESH
jgi:hypothetical protein